MARTTLGIPDHTLIAVTLVAYALYAVAAVAAVIAIAATQSAKWALVFGALVVFIAGGLHIVATVTGFALGFEIHPTALPDLALPLWLSDVAIAMVIGVVAGVWSVDELSGDALVPCLAVLTVSQVVCFTKAFRLLRIGDGL